MPDTSKQLFAETPYLRRISALPAQRLDAIDRQLQTLLQQGSTQLRKTHYFHGRYENIYVDAEACNEDFSDLGLLIDESLHNCAQMLDLPVEKLKIGYWFNLMEPGQVTTLHRHDDYDEVISGVVYLTVPENSGDLVLVTDEEEICLPPIQGNFIYFSPQTPHKVNENKSSQRRLSIGMNIGLPEDE